LARLTPSDGNGFAEVFGQSIAMSGDTIVVGAPYANNGAGAAYVFVKPASGWADMTETAMPTPSTGFLYLDFGFPSGSAETPSWLDLRITMPPTSLFDPKVDGRT